jgi:murein DD-endopeptidase MepM/ murein hydrolase activator NlpD
MTIKTHPHLIVVVGVMLLAVIALSFAVRAAVAQTDGWQTYTSDDAAYAFDYPPDTVITTSDDASQPYKIVYAEFTLTDTTDYQGISVMVLDNPQNLPARQFVAQRYSVAGIRQGAQAQRSVALTVDQRPAIRLQRDPVIGDQDKYSVLIPGEGVMYRVNLFGGGVGGVVEPPKSVQTIFDRVVKSFRVLAQTLKPKQTLLTPSTAAAEPAATDIFTYPLRSGAGVNYGVPVGIVNDDTHMEWLGYGIRNLDQWGVKCYGVDWTRMLHTGEDWYRLDGANTAGSPVYAVADGVVVRQKSGISYPGNVVLIRHRLSDGRDIYSMYGHVNNVSVMEGQTVRRGQQIATVLYQNYTGRTPSQHPKWDSHLHFEMRYFLDGTAIYTPGTNAYGYNYPACTYAYPGRGYTYLISPDDYPYPGAGYTAPTVFINAHLGGTTPPPTCTPRELIQNGGFESGVPATPWTATNSLNKNDPLVYKTRPHVGTWGGWLGNVLNYTDALAQQVSVPSGSTRLVLTFWRQVRSAEAAGRASDSMTVQLSNASGQVIGTPLVITSAAARNTWAKESVTFDVTGYSGQATLSFTGRNNASAVSSFFIDDVSLVRACP